MKKQNKTIYALLIITTIVLVIILLIYSHYIGTSISDDSNEWANLGAFLGGAFGSVLTLVTIWVIVYSNLRSDDRTKEQINLLEKQTMYNDTVKLLNNLENIETYYLKYVDYAKEHIDLEQKIREVATGSAANKKDEINRLKGLQSKIIQRYKDQSKPNKRIYTKIYESKLYMDLYYSNDIDIRKFLAYYLQSAKTINTRLMRGLITDSSKIFFDPVYYMILKEKIYNLIIVRLTGQDLKYNNLKDGKYSIGEEIRKELESWSTL